MCSLEKEAGPIARPHALVNRKFYTRCCLVKRAIAKKLFKDTFGPQVLDFRFGHTQKFLADVIRMLSQ